MYSPIRRSLAATFIAVVSLVLCTAASALTVTGRTVGGNGVTVIPNSYVHIHNNSTGANGSTYSDANGYYTFTNIASGTVYVYWSEHCQAGFDLRSADTAELGSLGAPWLKMNPIGSC